MDHRLIEGLMEAIAPVIRDSLTAHVEKATAPLVAQIEELKSREPIKGEPGLTGEPGQSVTVEDMRPLIDEAVAKLPPAEPGKSVDPQEVELLIASHVEKAVSALPIPENGKDADPEVVANLLREDIAALVDEIPRPENGKDADLGEVRLFIAEEVAKIPPPSPGKDGERGPPGDIALAPEDIVDQVASAVRLLAESPAIKIVDVVSPDPIEPVKRTFRFERDSEGRVLAAHEGDEA